MRARPTALGWVDLEVSTQILWTVGAHDQRPYHAVGRNPPVHSRLRSIPAEHAPG